jgi:Domain of unknown function (DUF3463)
MEETNWDSYGTGKYEKCANCMVHCGFEATAVEDAFNHPTRALQFIETAAEIVARERSLARNRELLKKM